MYLSLSLSLHIYIYIYMCIYIYIYVCSNTYTARLLVKQDRPQQLSCYHCFLRSVCAGGSDICI